MIFEKGKEALKAWDLEKSEVVPIIKQKKVKVGI